MSVQPLYTSAEHITNRSAGRSSAASLKTLSQAAPRFRFSSYSGVRLPQSVSVFYRLVRKKLFQSARSLVGIAFLLWLKRIEHIERLPRRGPAIIVSNHVSHMDWIVLTSIFRKQPAVIVSAQELASSRFVRWLTRWMTVICVDRERPPGTFFKEVIQHLRGKKCVIIFPEGTRSRNGKRQPVKAGFVKLALIARVPVVPIGIRGTFDILPPHRAIPRLARCELAVGQAIRLDGESSIFEDILQDDQHTKIDDVCLRELAERIMDIVGDLAGPAWDDGLVRSKHQYDWEILRNGRSAKRRLIPAAFFDVDNTIVACHTQKEFALLCRRRGYITRTELAKVAGWFALSNVGLVVDNRSFRESLYHQFSRYTTEEISVLFEEAFVRYIRPRILLRAASLIKWHKKQGHRVVLVSASIRDLVVKLQKEVEAHDTLATDLELCGRSYSGRIKGELMEGHAKARAIRIYAKENDVDLEVSYAYGNGFSDIRMLSTVGYPTVVNPDRRLLNFAKQRGWPILHFS